MIALWSFYWPVFTAGLLLGLGAAWLALYRKPRTNLARLVTGGALAVAATAAWHAPLGSGERLASSIENAARAELVRLELPFIRARIERDPLSRTLVLVGTADRFQRRELPRYMRELVGVDAARWARPGAQRPTAVPLLAEAMLLALTGFGLGLLLVYLLELRRRARTGRRYL